MNRASSDNNLSRLPQNRSTASEEVDTLRWAEAAFGKTHQTKGWDNSSISWAETLGNRTRLQVSREDWVNVAETLQELLSGIATTVAATPMPGEVRGVLRHARGQGDRLAWALLQEGRAEDAMRGAELGRAMMLRAHSAFALVTPGDATGERLLDLRAVWRAAVARLEATGQSINDEVRESFEAFRKALEEAGLGTPAPLSVADISGDLPAGGVLVMPIMTEHGGAVFFVRQGQTALTDDHVLPLPDLTTASVRQLLARDLNDDANDEPDWTGWLPGYGVFQSSINQYFQPRRGAVAVWNSQIESTLSEMWDLIMKPVHEHLIKLGLTSGDKTGNEPGDPDDTAAPEVVLALPGLMSNLPWHAAGYQQKDGSRYFALRSWAISYIPSLGTMIGGRRKLEKLRDTPNSLFAVTNPDNSFLDANKKLIRQSPVWDLFEDPYRTDLKGAKVAASHHDDVATLARITEAMPQAKYLVLYTHGSGNLAGADTAALVTVDDPLTIGHLRRMNLEAARYAMLAACDSGTLDIQHLPDEFSGMQLSMLEAGCPGACGTLWPVEVSVTAPLVRDFFSHHLGQPGTGGPSPAQALRRAQLNMLDHAEPAPDSAVASTASGFDEDEDTGETQPKDGNTQEHHRRLDVALPFFWAAFAHWGV